MTERCEKLSVRGLYPVEGRPGHVRAQWTGEKRPPKQGEYFLSGSAIAAYRAFVDMSEPMHIARIMLCKRVEYWQVIGPYYPV